MEKLFIEKYSFGSMIINGREYVHDLIILPDKIIPNWWREEGHRLKIIDLKKYLELDKIDIDTVVIGTGYNGLMRVDDEVVKWFRDKGLEVHVYDTRRAVEKYNELVAKERKVLAMFHLTC